VRVAGVIKGADEPVHQLWKGGVAPPVAACKAAAAPLFRPARQNGRTLFLDLATLEPHKDQWAYLSTLGRMSPQELKRAADRAGKIAVATEVTRLVTASSTTTQPQAAAVLRARLGAGIRLEQAELAPELAATLRHATSMHNPLFYERSGCVPPPTTFPASYTPVGGPAVGHREHHAGE
jgi:hypothetical protein